MSSIWRYLQIAPEELRLETTLKCGQSFRWKVSGENEWSCAFKGRLVTLRQMSSGISFRTYPINSTVSSSTSSQPEQKTRQTEKDLDSVYKFLHDYFQLNLNLSECYARWSAVDPNFAKVAQQFQGIRILRQDPVENLICFICSSNNNINRISQMIEKLCRKYGKKICTLNNEDYFDFPTLEKLARSNVEEELKKLGFGYRAKYISQTANYILNNISDGEKWLFSLRNASYKDAHSSLLRLSGVGPKVADCVCLMSLDKQNAIPVDTHVWQIAKREYGFDTKPGKSPKTLTNRMYEEISDHFRTLFGDYSGWAHSVLFAADLKVFENRHETASMNDNKLGDNGLIPLDKTFSSTKKTLISVKPKNKDLLIEPVKKKIRKNYT
ncbi:6330_t:CDS:2 [Ambispora gerdemannii]|uniref:N-glycosylase/DNA lyase n=1 Tax=Ambispora gerdemannii TaxID=144530 RepID=A0A9N8UVY9_9GLOM|nr:6330_t:CDS:2 [Ambispora gerdemannii]